MFLNLGLGRMGCLVGALGISAALDLNFASGTFPREVTHSRSGAATQVYDDGLVDYAPENLLLYSRTLSNGAWTGSNRTISDNTTADPPGTTGGTTADTIVEDTSVGAFHWIAQAVTKPAVAERYLFTGYCHSSSARDIAVYLQNGANGCNARFRPSTGVNTGPAATFGSGWSSVSSSITSIGGGWHRFALQATSDGTTSITAQIALYNAAWSYTGDGTSGAVVYGLRLQRGTHSRAEDDFLLQTTSAAVYGPHITYDPSSLACLGYLNEPQRTNVLTYSQAFDNAAWEKQASPAVSIAASAAAAPDSTLTAKRLVAASSAGTFHYVRQASVAIAAGAVTLSVWAKPGGYNYAELIIGSNSSYTKYAAAYFDISAGTYVSSRAATYSVAAYSVQQFASGWCRLSLTVVTDVASPSATFTVGATTNPIASFTGNGTDGIDLWGAQLEAASTASSYIPTTSASATRAADVAYVDVATWLPALSITNATFYAEFVANGLEPTNFERILSPDSIKTFLSVENSTTIGAYDGGVTATASGAAVVGGSRKAAASLGAALRTVAYGGTTGTHATNFYDAPTRLYIGSNQGSGNFFSGTIKTARTYYGEQSAAQIATLTT